MWGDFGGFTLGGFLLEGMLHPRPLGIRSGPGRNMRIGLRADGKHRKTSLGRQRLSERKPSKCSGFCNQDKIPPASRFAGNGGC